MKVELIRISNKLAYYKRSKDNDVLTALLDDLLKIEVREVPWYSEIATHKLFMKKEYTRKLQYDEWYVYIPIPMIALINYRVRDFEFELHLEGDKESLPNLEVTEAIESQLRKVYGEHSDKLIELLQTIALHRRGLVDLPTSFGKTWSILGLLTIFLENNDGRCLIIASGSAVVQEIRSRLPLFQVDPSRVMIENSVSLRAQRFYTEEYKKVMEETKFIIIDECDSIFSTMDDFLSKHSGYKSIVGFTATSDYAHGQKLSLDVKFPLLRGDVYKILAYVGHEIVTARPEANINLKMVYCNFSNCKPYMESEFLKFKQAVQYVIDSDKFIKFLEYVNERQKDTLYLPINNKNLIDKVIQRARMRHSPIQDKFIFWDAGEISLVSNGRRFANHTELNKWLLNTPHEVRPDIILATRASYRGVSLPSLTDILFVENSNFRNVPQSIGRTMRSELPTVWVPVETSNNNVLFKAMALKRFKIINQTYPNLNKEFINFDKPKE